MKPEKPNILIHNEAEFINAFNIYTRDEVKPVSESKVGLKPLFYIRPPSSNTYITSNFDFRCKTSFVAKVIDEDAYKKFWKYCCGPGETFTSKRTDCETLEQFNEYLTNEKKYNEIVSKRYKIIKAIEELASLMDKETLKALQKDRFWVSEIGHIRRKLSLYVNTIPTFDSLNVEPVETGTDLEDVTNFVKGELDKVEQSIELDLVAI